jgi:hypothetical protein
MSGTTNFLARSVNTANRPEIPAGDLASTIDVAALRALAALGGDREKRGSLLGVSAASTLLLTDLVEHVRHLGKQHEIIAKVVKKLDPVTSPNINGAVSAPAPADSINQAACEQPASGSTDLRITAVLDQNSLCQFGPVIAAGLNEALQTPMRELGQHAAEIVNVLCKAVTQQATQLGHMLEVLRKMDCDSRLVEELRATQAIQTSCLVQLETKQSETMRRLNDMSRALDNMGCDIGALAEMTAAVEQEVVEKTEALAGATVGTAEEGHAARGVRSRDKHSTPKNTR